MLPLRDKGNKPPEPHTHTLTRAWMRNVTAANSPLMFQSRTFGQTVLRHFATELTGPPGVWSQNSEGQNALSVSHLGFSAGLTGLNSMSRQITFTEAGENYLHIRYRALPLHIRQLSQSNKREVLKHLFLLWQRNYPYVARERKESLQLFCDTLFVLSDSCIYIISPHFFFSIQYK